MIDLSSIPAVAKDIITQVGNSAVLRTKGVSVYDPATGTGTNSNVDTNIKVVFSQYGSEQVGGDVLSGDVEFMVVTDTPPTNQDKILFNGLEFNIINIKPTIAQDLVFYYDVHSRI